MRIVPPRIPALLALLLLALLAASGGCASMKRQWEDFTQYMHDDVVRW
ncbi:MAG: hypothetical protein IT574_03330 [Candidatus Aureabacteria bacterium]|nr:hypothetical protein [Candidatus Auribacterota bacterium]NLW94221.1 hypothetical protein [Chlamydiota bacterium]HOE26121.1 hypothetical protein [bacterium]HQM51570.1 hypothetical protein [bacterium]